MACQFVVLPESPYGAGNAQVCGAFHTSNCDNPDCDSPLCPKHSEFCKGCGLDFCPDCFPYHKCDAMPVKSVQDAERTNTRIA